MKRISSVISVLFSLFCMLCSMRAYALVDSIEPVTMQLRWHHQFQFAGYYAAKHKGFYEEAGFDVTILAGSPDRQPVTEVLEGRADFAEGNSEVVLSRLKGEPLLALAAIYQYSPSALITLADSHIRYPMDLADKRVMMVKNGMDADLLAMINKASLDIHVPNIIESSYNLQDLIDGKTDAFNAYMTNEPYFLEERGIRYRTMSPKDYGVNFYSDILFTSEAQLKRGEDRIKAFRDASIEGWRYALEHPEEIIRIIKDQYHSSKSLNHLRYEANTIREYVMSDIVDVGHIHPDRFRQMSEVFVKQEFAKPEDLEYLDGFVFKPKQPVDSRLAYGIALASLLALIAISVAIYLTALNRRLKQEVARRHKTEEEVRKLAYTDELTGLYNRRAIMEKYETSRRLALRYRTPFTIILFDLDNFKKVNDTYGHDVGDQVIRAAAAAVMKLCRNTDMCGRIGGEEFVLVMPNTTAKDAEGLAQRLKVEIESATFDVPDHKPVLKVTASFGIAQWYDHCDESLIVQADRAMYRAKEQGKNQVNCFRH